MATAPGCAADPPEAKGPVPGQPGVAPCISPGRALPSRTHPEYFSKMKGQVFILAQILKTPEPDARHARRREERLAAARRAA
ncbi:hypothetical protein C0V75_08825 [Tabrizicola sp. TH137]|nr:hypothetical protein C0V75_08825 [Tabrizicola sp. TH137]